MPTDTPTFLPMVTAVPVTTSAPVPVAETAVPIVIRMPLTPHNAETIEPMPRSSSSVQRIPVHTKDVAPHPSVAPRIPVHVVDVAPPTAGSNPSEGIPVHVVDVASSPPTAEPERIPVRVVDVSDLSPSPTVVPRIPVHIVDVASNAPTTQVTSVAKALADELSKKLTMPQGVNDTLKKLVDIQSAVEDQIARVDAQSKALLKYQQMQKQHMDKPVPKAEDRLSIDDLRRQFDDLTKRVQSHEQVIGDLKKAVKVHLANHPVKATSAPVSLDDLSKQFDDLTKRVESHEKAIGQLNKTVQNRLQPTPSTKMVCKSSPVICNAAAQLAAEIEKHTEYAHNLAALKTHIATLGTQQ